MTRVRPRLALLRPFREADRSFLAAQLDDLFELVDPPGFDPAGLAQAMTGAEVVLAARMGADLLAGARDLRLVQTPGVGLEGLDLPAIKRAGAMVSNSHSNALYVAEHALGLTLDVVRRITRNDSALRRRAIDPTCRDHFGASLHGATVAVLGLGHVGAEVIRLLAPFRSRVLGVCRTHGRHRDLGVSIVDLEAALAEADVVVVALPLTPATKGLLDARALAGMKDRAVLVNVSRAEVVDRAALLARLGSGRLGGAALDVWWSSDMAQDAFDFLPFDNVVLSPHSAGSHRDFATHLPGVVDNLRAFALTGRPIDLVDLDAGY